MVNCICDSDRPLIIAAPLVKMAFVALCGVRQTRNIKITFPLKMRRATRSALSIVKLLKYFHCKPKPPCRVLRGGFGHRKENNMKKQRKSV